ncbi:amidase [Emericellopsis atlantica]|uniref:Amidase n=1 Tax=Emericellopsis atlantica TaxID=2614577 RepID=A0A9P8CMD0_9HYPO|nr:amidase [Emericellopsis atlantica]KAG9251982.1 amidase [Emericellopsis atlantica]
MSVLFSKAFSTRERRSIRATAELAISLEEEVKITVGETDYVLVPTTSFVDFDGNPSSTVLFILEQDDVFQPAFCSNVVFYGSTADQVQVHSDVIHELKLWNTTRWIFVAGDTSPNVARGPYVFVKSRVWQPWRVYRDFNATFMLDSPEAGIDGRVIVPSRCYYKPSAARPLEGARIGVKDSIDIAGHKTTLNNRAWRQLYPPATKHAHCVQLLLDAGAIVIGKLKLQAMIVREEPVEAVEFTDPFNPRGDGYQVPSGSSSGSAAAVGSYNWLDFSIGSDTNGSVRKPAHYNGCHTIRPTTGIMNNEGVVGQLPLFDMPGFFGRDLSKFPEFMSVWYGDSPRLLPPPKVPVTILYPRDYLSTPSQEQTKVIDRFVAGLEGALAVKRTAISIAERWAEDSPDGQEHHDISKYLETKKAGIYPFFYDSYHALESFRNEYKEKYGKAPFVHRYVHWQWDVARGMSKEERDECWRRCQVYRQWLLDRIFKVQRQGQLAYYGFPDQGRRTKLSRLTSAVSYSLQPYGLLNGFASLNMSPIMQAPEITAIVGQISFDSVVTQRTEPYPVAASVIGPPGADFIVTELTIKGLETAGIPIKVKTGPGVY